MDEKPMLDELVCPLGLAPLRREEEVLVCTRCGLRFEIRDEIPNMLIEEATLPDGCNGLRDLKCVRSGQARLDD